MTCVGLSKWNHEEPVPWITGRVIVMTVVLVALSSALVLSTPSLFAKRLCGAVLPDSENYGYAQTLLCYLALCGLASVLLLAGLWCRNRRISYATWGRWCLWSSVGLYVAASLSLWWYIDDDAGISFTYARNLACGRGLVFNPGDVPVEGYSNPLWVLLLSTARLCGADIVVTAKFMGILFGALCLVLIYCALRTAHPLSMVALPLAASSASMIIWYNSGLENSLHGLLLVGCVVLMAKYMQGRRTNPGIVALLCLLVLSRPEGFVFALAVAFLMGMRAWRRNEALWPAAVTLVIPAMVLVALTLFRLFYFYDILPNTFYAKASSTNPLRVLNPFSGGWGYVGKAMDGGGWTIAIIPLLILFVNIKKSPTVVPGALAIVIGQLFFVISVGGDWMAEFRFIAPIVPIITILIALGLVNLLNLLNNIYGIRRWNIILCLLPAFLIVQPQLQRLVVFAHSPTTPMELVARIGESFSELASHAGIQDPTLLAHDAGGTSYVAQIRLIDLAGLCDRTLAKHRHDCEMIRRYLFHEKQPTFIFSAKVFADRIGLENFSEFHSDYVPLPPAPSPELDGDIRCIRRDLYPRVADLLVNGDQSPDQRRAHSEYPSTQEGQ